MNKKRMTARKIQYLFIGLFFRLGMQTQEKFNIRGVLPQHDSLSRLTSWNLSDYRNYLDECQKDGINFIGFHNYTGGGERYATYVESMIKIEYKNILPQACFDNSPTVRWGYLPMTVRNSAHDVGKIFHLPAGAEVFGNDGSITSHSPWKHYERIQGLMRDVLKMAYERGVRMAMRFGFGVVPPEHFSLNAAGDCFYWSDESSTIPNLKSQMVVEIHHVAIDDILKAYPDIDYIRVWLSEHLFMGVDTQKALRNASFVRTYRENESSLEEAADSSARFIGVQVLEYMKPTYDHLKSGGPHARLILGGWGGGHQLSSLLKGLDRALPKDIIFSCLNPDLGKSPRPELLGEIAWNHNVWAVPWLEDDHQLWHLQPRVHMMREHVKPAAKQGLDGVVVIHWRMEEPRFNFRTSAHFTSDKDTKESMEQLYDRFLTEEFGKDVAEKMTPLLVGMNWKQVQWNVSSSEFYACTPERGLLDENNVRIRKELVSSGESSSKKLKGEQRDNLERFIAMFRLESFLGEADRAIIFAFTLKEKEVQGKKIDASREHADAYRLLLSAPIKEIFDTYVKRVHSRGELGVPSSLNQRVWCEYNELRAHLENKIKQK